MGLFQSIADAVYREYDRRIKRASLITEYGTAHHSEQTASALDTPEELEEEAEIMNIPRGTPVLPGVREQESGFSE